MNGNFQHGCGSATAGGQPSESSQLANCQAQLTTLIAQVGRLELQLRQYAQTNGSAPPDAVNAPSPQEQAAAAADDVEKPADVPMAASRVVMHEIVLPHMVDAMSICFGGQVSAVCFEHEPHKHLLHPSQFQLRSGWHAD